MGLVFGFVLVFFPFISIEVPVIRAHFLLSFYSAPLREVWPIFLTVSHRIYYTHWQDPLRASSFLGLTTPPLSPPMPDASMPWLPFGPLLGTRETAELDSESPWFSWGIRKASVGKWGGYLPMTFALPLTVITAWCHTLKETQAVEKLVLGVVC